MSDRLVADGGLPLRLPYDGPLDWDAMLAYFDAHAVPGVEHVSGHVYRRTVVIGGDPGVLELYPGDANALTLVAHLPHWSEVMHLAKRARHIANLDLDLEEALRVLAEDPVLGPSIDSAPGRRPPGTWDPFETGVQAIIGQRRNSTAAAQVMDDLVQQLGTRVHGLELFGLTHTFPAAEVLADADLCGLDLTRGEGETIAALARAVVDDVVRFDWSVSLEQLVEALVAVPGLEHETAQYIALRLGEPDAFPTANGGAESWKPWRAVAAMHLSSESATAADRTAA